MAIRAFKPAYIFREAGVDPKISLGVGIPDDIGGAWWWPLYLSEAKPFNKGFTPRPNCGW
jgi:hypothetical protein